MINQRTRTDWQIRMITSHYEMANRLMPLLRSFDLLMGLGMLAYPIRAIPLWLVIWGIFTALLRPLSGEPFAEFIERAGNFGAPLGDRAHHWHR
jgi:hypothetical protein